MNNEPDDLHNLLALVDATEDEEEVLVNFSSATWSGCSMELGLTVSLADSKPMVWRVRCDIVLAYLLRDHEAYSIELVDDHPLLYEFQNETASAYFLGTPASAESALGALYEAHSKAVGGWIGFRAYLNGTAQLLASGSGLLARGPVPILKAYQEALLLHGVEVSICAAQAPSFWDGNTYREIRPEDKPKALLMDNSYVVGMGWTARQES